MIADVMTEVIVLLIVTSRYMLYHILKVYCAQAFSQLVNSVHLDRWTNLKERCSIGIYY